MQYQVTGRHIELGGTLRRRVEDALETLVSKYAQRAVESHVVFTRDGHQYACEVSVHLPTGLTAQTKAKASEIYAAFDLSCDKLGKQLRRYKRRLKNHNSERPPVSYSDAPSFILAPEADTHEDEEPETLQPVIVAELETRIPTLSVGEAVMQMELAGSPLLVFHSEAHGGVNVVFRRDDGNYGWIDPPNTPPE